MAMIPLWSFLKGSICAFSIPSVSYTHLDVYKRQALLSALNENRGRIVTVDALCMAAWRGENLGYENTLMVHMRRLREKIEPDPSHPRYLITMRGPVSYTHLTTQETRDGSTTIMSMTPKYCAGLVN